VPRDFGNVSEHLISEAEDKSELPMDLTIPHTPEDMPRIADQIGYNTLKSDGPSEIIHEVESQIELIPKKNLPTSEDRPAVPQVGNKSA